MDLWRKVDDCWCIGLLSDHVFDVLRLALRMLVGLFASAAAAAIHTQAIIKLYHLKYVIDKHGFRATL